MTFQLHSHWKMWPQISLGPFKIVVENRLRGNTLHLHVIACSYDINQYKPVTYFRFVTQVDDTKSNGVDTGFVKNIVSFEHCCSHTVYVNGKSKHNNEWFLSTYQHNWKRKNILYWSIIQINHCQKGILSSPFRLKQESAPSFAFDILSGKIC